MGRSLHGVNQGVHVQPTAASSVMFIRGGLQYGVPERCINLERNSWRRVDRAHLVGCTLSAGPALD